MIAYPQILTLRWAPEILLALGTPRPGTGVLGPAGSAAELMPWRFNTLMATVAGISDRVLTERLREMADQGLVERDVIPGPPVKVYYRLTEAGERYLPGLRELSRL